MEISTLSHISTRLILSLTWGCGDGFWRLTLFVILQLIANIVSREGARHIKLLHTMSFTLGYASWAMDWYCLWGEVSHCLAHSFFRQCSIDHSIVSKIPNNTNLDHHYFTSLGNLFFLSLLNADLPWIKEHIFFFLKSKKWQSPRMHFLQQYFSICNFTLEFHFSAFPTEWVNVLLNSI